MGHRWNDDEHQRSEILTEEPTTVPLCAPLPPQVALRLILRFRGDNPVVNRLSYIYVLSRLYFTRSRTECART
jgi:hypothetical protein